MAMAANAAETMDLPVSAGRLHRISHDVYQEMGRSGLIAGEDRVVLIEGLLVTKRAKGPAPHPGRGERRRDLRHPWPGGLSCAEGGSDPPARAQARGPRQHPGARRGAGPRHEGDLRDRLPEVGEIALVVEVADSSLAEDRKLLPVYARAGIPVVWIVSLDDETVEVHSAPCAGDVDAPMARDGPRRGAVLEIIDRGTFQALGRVAVADILA